MTYFPLSDDQRGWLERAETVAAEVLAPAAAETDRSAAFPKAQLDAFRDGGFMGLRADRAHGGQGQGLLTTCLVTEALAKACPSTALIYKMHLESIEMVVAGPDGRSRPSSSCRSSLRVSGSRRSPAARPDIRAAHGRARRSRPSRRSTAATGSPTSTSRSSPRPVIADSYFFMCSLPGAGGQLGLASSCSSSTPTTSPGASTHPWDGLGMRGNNSSPMTFEGLHPR